MTYNEIVEKIRALTPYDRKNPTQRALKICEEAGEIAEAILSQENAPGCEYKTMDRNDSGEECVDVLIVTLSLLSQLDFSDQEISDIFERKLAKWERVCS